MSNTIRFACIPTPNAPDATCLALFGPLCESRQHTRDGKCLHDPCDHRSGIQSLALENLTPRLDITLHDLAIELGMELHPPLARPKNENGVGIECSVREDPCVRRRSQDRFEMGHVTAKCPGFKDWRGPAVPTGQFRLFEMEGHFDRTHRPTVRVRSGLSPNAWARS